MDECPVCGHDIKEQILLSAESPKVFEGQYDCECGAILELEMEYCFNVLVEEVE